MQPHCPLSPTIERIAEDRQDLPQERLVRQPFGLVLAEDLPAGMAAVPLNPGVIDTAMLRQSFGGEAGGYPTPEEWVKKAGPFILGLGPEHNGQSLTVA